MINPDNVPVDEETGFYPDDVNDRFERTWRTCIGSWLVLATIGCAMIFAGPARQPKKDTLTTIERENFDSVIDTARSGDAMDGKVNLT